MMLARCCDGENRKFHFFMTWDYLCCSPSTGTSGIILKVDAKVKHLRVHLKMDEEYVIAESGITVINFLLLLTEDINPVWLDTTWGYTSTVLLVRKCTEVQYQGELLHFVLHSVMCFFFFAMQKKSFHTKSMICFYNLKYCCKFNCPTRNRC